MTCLVVYHMKFKNHLKSQPLDLSMQVRYSLSLVGGINYPVERVKESNYIHVALYTTPHGGLHLEEKLKIL